MLVILNVLVCFSQRRKEKRERRKKYSIQINFATLRENSINLFHAKAPGKRERHKEIFLLK